MNVFLILWKSRTFGDIFKWGFWVRDFKYNYIPYRMFRDNSTFILYIYIFIYLENKLLLIPINFTPKTSHSCLKKWHTMFSRYVFFVMWASRSAADISENWAGWKLFSTSFSVSSFIEFHSWKKKTKKHWLQVKQRELLKKCVFFSIFDKGCNLRCSAKRGNSTVI